jgi:signal transduction histidine kinase
MKGIAIWLAIFVTLTAPLAKAAESLIVSEAYWVDESKAATLGDAKKADFKPFEGSLSMGFKPYALWVKVRIAANFNDEKIALIIKPAFIRRIELYDPDLVASDTPVVPVVSGRDAGITPINHIGVDNGFIIPTSRKERTIFLRITTTTALVADISVEPLAEAEFGSQSTLGMLLVYVAFLCAILLWALVGWVVRRDVLYGLFALRLVFSIFHLSVMSGLLRYFFAGTLGASARDSIYNFILVTVIAVTGSFDFKLISEFGVPQWLRKFAWSLLCLPAACLMLVMLGHTQMALHMNTFVVSVFVIMNVVMAFSISNKEKNPLGQMATNTIRVAYFLMAMVVIGPALIITNILNASVPVMKIVFLHALITTVTLFIILTIRARQRDLLAQQAILQFELKEQELQRESERRSEKERFLSMLVHELRNPLSVIRLRTSASTSSGKAVHLAVREMAQIIERVEQTEVLELVNQPCLKSSFDLGPFLREIVADHPAESRIALDALTNFSVETDPEILKGIVRNLLDNAGKYSPDTSCIQVALTKQMQDDIDGVGLSITNEVGEAGIPDAERLFTKYYRSPGSHRSPGSGLGLYLVANWAKALGGKIDYHLVAGEKGSSRVRFSLWLPK